MKTRFLTLIITLLLTISLIGCNNKKYTLVDISGLSLDDATALVDSNIEFDVEYVETLKYYPDTVIGYSNNQVGDEVKISSKVKIQVSKLMNDTVVHDDSSIVWYSTVIGKFTGPESINGEVLNDSGIYGTDLGMSIDLGSEIIYLFGDTFSGEKRTGLWFSNFVARSTDRDFYDNVKFDSVVSRDNGMAQPFAQGAHQQDDKDDLTKEVTKIPTGGIRIGDYVYIFYMSVRYWGVGGEWLVTYNQCVKSRINDLFNWVNVESLRWDEGEAYNFGQIYPYKDPKSDYVYLYSIPGGRSGKPVVSRVLVSNFENRDEYEYQVSANTWVKGDEGLNTLNTTPYYVRDQKASELSVCYNEYLKKYMMVYSIGGNATMFTSDTPYGEFGNPVVLHSAPYYGTVTSEALLADGGRIIYFPGSYWTEYNTYFIQVVLK